MDRKSKIAIIGGGIGGLTAAIALHQKGFTNISIYERRSNLQISEGAGFVIWANSGWVLNKLGLLDEVKVIGGRLNQLQRRTANGDYLGSIEIAEIDEKIGSTSYAVSRSEFQKLLQKKAVSLKIEFRKNSTVLNIQQSGTGKAFLKLADNSYIWADIIIGADGRMNSITRNYIHGDKSPVYQGFINWVGMIGSDYSLPLENNVLDYWGCGERFGIVPISKNKVYWAGCKALPLTSSNTEPNDRLELLSIFKHWSPLIKKVIEQTHLQHIKRIPIFDHDPNPVWFKNNVCLLGDSAHASLPTTGQGACQAIEDAWHLANQLVRFESLNQSFEAYRNIRYTKTTEIIFSGRAFAKSLFNTDKDYCLERNEKAKLTDYKIATQIIAELWSRSLN